MRPLISSFAKSKAWTWLKLWLPLVGLAWIPPLTDWLENRYQVDLQDLYLPLFLGALTALLVSIVFYRRFKKQPLAGYLAAILTTIILANDYGDRLNGLISTISAFNPIPGLQQTTLGILYSLVFCVLVFLAAGWVGLKAYQFVERKKWNMKDFVNGLTIMVSVIFLFQFVPTVKAVIIEWPQFFYRPPALPSNAVGNVTSKPDIYYIVLDRYANEDVLSSQMNFDNSSFLNYLQTNGFASNPYNHQNYPYTTMSISSTLNMNYQTDLVQKFGSASEQTIFPYHDAIRYSSVISSLKSIGYQYYELANWYETSNVAPLANHYYQQEGVVTFLNHQYTLDNLPKDELIKNVFWSLFNANIQVGKFMIIGYHGQSGQDQTMYQLNTLKQIASEPSGGRFIFAHILVPHDPYYFNADGSLNQDSGTDNNGEPIMEKYTNQVQFINAQMQQLITQIKQQSDGKAVIILQSDEGPYPMELKGENFDESAVEGDLATGSMLTWSNSDLQMKYGNLAAYYVPGASTSDLATAGNNLDIFRLVFNTYFGGTLNYLPECYYAYPNGRAQPFVYTNINKQLTGTTNNACASTSNFTSK